MSSGFKQHEEQLKKILDRYGYTADYEALKEELQQVLPTLYIVSNPDYVDIILNLSNTVWRSKLRTAFADSSVSDELKLKFANDFMHELFFSVLILQICAHLKNNPAKNFEITQIACETINWTINIMYTGQKQFMQDCSNNFNLDIYTKRGPWMAETHKQYQNVPIGIDVWAYDTHGAVGLHNTNNRGWETVETTVAKFTKQLCEDVLDKTLDLWCE